MVCHRHMQKGNMTSRQDTEGIIDMKEHIWNTNIKYLRLSLNTSWALVFCVHTFWCTISKVVGKNKKIDICLPNKEYISGHR